MTIRIIFLLLGSLFLKTAAAQEYITEDAERFAHLFKANPDTISPELVKSEYLKPGTRGIKIFTPKRIKNARNLAQMIHTYRNTYRKGVNLMLPAALALSEEAVQLLKEVQQLLDQDESAPVYLVFGGNNAGGTASRKGLVIGLEVLGRYVKTEEEAKELIKSFIAHEVVHAYQSRSGNRGRGDLLYQSLREGFADFVENMIIGEISNAEKERHEYGLAHEAQLWSEFKKVMDTREFQPWMLTNKPGNGRPADLGYWIGKRICEAYYSQAEDKAEALQSLLRLKDPEEILEQSGYEPER